jgi:hypothetical protein
MEYSWEKPVEEGGFTSVRGSCMTMTFKQDEESAKCRVEEQKSGQGSDVRELRWKAKVCWSLGR